jgi:hypothetical protein
MCPESKSNYHDNLKVLQFGEMTEWRKCENSRLCRNYLGEDCIEEWLTPGDEGREDRILERPTTRQTR